jgi:hypothetical protein
MEKKCSLWEIILFYALFFVAIYAVYIGKSLALPYFAALLVWAWLSKKNYFWIAFFFLILQKPGYFFTYAETSHLPVVPLLAQISLSPIDLFLMLMFAKVVFYRKQWNFKLKNTIIILWGFFIFYLLAGIFVFDVSAEAASLFARPIMYYTWIMFFIAFINEEDLFKFFQLIFPVIFFIFFTQLFFLVRHQEFVNLFDSALREKVFMNIETGELRATGGGWLLVLLSYIGALLILQSNKKMIGKAYLHVIAGVSFLSVHVSATRFSFVVLSIIAIGVYFRQIKNLPKILVSGLLVLIILFSLISLGVISKEQINSSIERISQLSSLFKGAVRDIQTLDTRINNFLPVLDKIRERIFFGYGFSDTALTYYSTDVGVPNTFLMFGVAGFMMFLFLFISYFKMLSYSRAKLDMNNIYHGSIKVLSVSFVAMLIAYFSTWDFFSLRQPEIVAFMMVFFAISEIIANSTNVIQSKIN